MKKKILEINGFKFPWKVSMAKGNEQYKYLDESIRRCEQDDITIQKKNINFSEIKILFDENTNIFIFVPHSQFMFYPVYCVLWDIATPTERALLEETVLAISKKFKNSNLFENDKVKLQKLLYSEENQKRLKEFELKLRPIEDYYY